MGYAQYLFTLATVVKIANSQQSFDFLRMNGCDHFFAMGAYWGFQGIFFDFDHFDGWA